MHYDSLISMNITYNGLILNQKYPILFYWNGENDPIEDICNDKKIISLLKKSIFELKQYESAQIHYVTYKFDGETDHYEEKSFYIKDYFNYDQVSEKVKHDIIVNILNEAHYKVFNEYCQADIIDVLNDDFKNKVETIIKAIRSHYTKEISNETLLNYVRKTYKEQQHDYLTKIKEENEEIIVSTLEKVL